MEEVIPAVTILVQQRNNLEETILVTTLEETTTTQILSYGNISLLGSSSSRD